MMNFKQASATARNIVSNGISAHTGKIKVNFDKSLTRK